MCVWALLIPSLSILFGEPTLVSSRIKAPSSKEKTRQSVLFFFRKRCHLSQKAYQYLEHLGFDVTGVQSTDFKESLPEDINWWQGDYILCFRSFFVLPCNILKKAAKGAINFHPGPPEYPGNGCLNWALYDNAKYYGVTTHIMDERIDNGAIVECRRFPLLKQDNVDTLLARTHHKLFDLFIDISTGLALEGNRFLDNKLAESQSESWRGKARKMSDLDNLQQVDASITKRDLEKIIRATYTSNFPPVINLHGHKFFLKK